MPAASRRHSMLGIEIGVVMGVTGVLMLIFDALTTGDEEMRPGPSVPGVGEHDAGAHP